MSQRTWIITGVSSGFGKEIAQQVLKKGDRVIGTVRNTKKIQDLINTYSNTFEYCILDVTDTLKVHRVIGGIFENHDRLYCIYSDISSLSQKTEGRKDYSDLIRCRAGRISGKFAV